MCMNSRVPDAGIELLLCKGSQSSAPLSHLSSPIASDFYLLNTFFLSFVCACAMAIAARWGGL